MVKLIRLFVLILVCAQLSVFAEESASEEELPTMEEVFESFVAANGGHTNIQEITSIIVSGQIRSANGEEQSFKLYRKRPDLMRLRVELEDFSVETLFDGTSAYRRLVATQGKGEYMPLEDVETQTIKADSAIEGPFYVLAREYGALTLAGVEDVRGLECYRFDVAEDHVSPVRSLWISAEDFNEVKLLRRSLGEKGEIVEQTVYFSDFRKVHGLSVAQTVEYWMDGEKTQDLSIVEVRANAGIFDRFFRIE